MPSWYLSYYPLLRHFTLSSISDVCSVTVLPQTGATRADLFWMSIVVFLMTPLERSVFHTCHFYCLLCFSYAYFNVVSCFRLCILLYKYASLSETQHSGDKISIDRGRHTYLSCFNRHVKDYGDIFSFLFLSTKSALRSFYFYCKLVHDFHTILSAEDVNNCDLVMLRWKKKAEWFTRWKSNRAHCCHKLILLNSISQVIFFSLCMATTTEC